MLLLGVRIPAQLVDPVADRALWANSFIRSLSDVLLLQSEVALAIAGAIQLGHFHHTTHVIAAAYAVMRNPDSAMKWLVYTVENGYLNLLWLLRDPHLGSAARGCPFQGPDVQVATATHALRRAVAPNGNLKTRWFASTLRRRRTAGIIPEGLRHLVPVVPHGARGVASEFRETSASPPVRPTGFVAFSDRVSPSIIGMNQQRPRLGGDAQLMIPDLLVQQFHSGLHTLRLGRAHSNIQIHSMAG